jgi:5'-deoxynucleotidase YfbR-like HD superfamily hydrolase
VDQILGTKIGEVNTSPLGLDLVELLTGDVNRLRYIKRFGTALCLHPENVAEHTFYVMVYSYFISLWAIKHGIDIDLVRVFQAGMVHDMEEVRTGDFPRPFKYRRAGLKELLDDAAHDEFADLMTSVLPEDGERVNELCFIWDTARDKSTPEGCIVALADFLSVVSHLYQEVNSANASMFQHFECTREYLDEFNDPAYDFMRPVITEVRRIVLKIFARGSNERLELHPE